MSGSRARRVVAEGVGTAFLLVAIVGSGITMGGDGAAGLFHHAAVVGGALVALIAALGPVSGAHFNPAVTLAFALDGDLPRRDVVAYVVVQVVGALAGVVAANLVFGEPAVAAAVSDRGGMARMGSEALATAGLVLVILGAVRSRQQAHVPYVVGAYITGAIVFTSSASFANPAVTIGRAVTSTWTGIQALHVPGFVLGQLVGTMAIVLLARWLFAEVAGSAPRPVPTTSSSSHAERPEHAR